MMQTQLLIATSSLTRGAWYRFEMTSLGFACRTASNGIECVEMLRLERPDIVLLETNLLWGGADGILAYRNDVAELRMIPFVLVGGDGVPLDTVSNLTDANLQGLFLHLPHPKVIATLLHQAVHDSVAVQVSS